MSRLWFANKKCSNVTITQYTNIATHTVEQALFVDDAAFVERLVERIDAISPDGDMMISFGPQAEHVELSFEGEGLIQKIHFYSRKIKTPSTGFNIDETQEELSIYRDMDALLFPEINKRILKIKNLKIQFSAFSITYLGSTYIDEVPSSLSFKTDRFIIFDKKGVEQVVEVVSGQLPPEPFEFKIENKSYVLKTFQSDSGDRLYPDYFQIVSV
jgi:hypothetical protein